MKKIKKYSNYISENNQLGCPKCSCESCEKCDCENCNCPECCKNIDINKDHRYLYIFEDGSISLHNDISEDDMQMCADGYVTIIDLITKKVEYGNGWEEIEKK